MPCRRVPTSYEDLAVALSVAKCRDDSATQAMGIIRAKRTAQAVLLVAAVAYMSLLLYQSVSALGYAQQVCLCCAVLCCVWCECRVAVRCQLKVHPEEYVIPCISIFHWFSTRFVLRVTNCIKIVTVALLYYTL